MHTIERLKKNHVVLLKQNDTNFTVRWADYPSTMERRIRGICSILSMDSEVKLNIVHFDDNGNHWYKNRYECVDDLVDAIYKLFETETDLFRKEFFNESK